jgi:ABC-type oligopeptide transport system substrate-binding subunit
MYKSGLFTCPNRKFISYFGPVLFLLLALTLAACDSATDTTTVPTQPLVTTDTTNTSSNPTVVTTNNAVSTTSPAQTSSLSTAPASNSTAGVAATSTASTNSNSTDQVLRMVGGGVTTLDPALASEVSSSFVIRQLFSGLVTLDNNLKVVPDLATALPTISDNGKTYTFTLKQNLHFASGKEITAADVKYSLERAADPKLAAPDSSDTLPAANYMNDIVGIKDKLSGKADNIAGLTVKDKYTIQFQLDSAKPYFLDKMTFNCYYIVNQENVAKGSNWFETPDVSGPFKLGEWQKDQLIRLVPNTAYPNGVPRLNEVDLLLGAAASNALNLYESSDNKIDLLNIGAGANAERALDKNSPLNKQLVLEPELDLTYLAFNNKVKPFDDPKIRQAFSLVVDRAKIARAMFEDKVVEAKTILPPGMPAYTGNPGTLTYNVSRARDLIAQSSYKSPANLPKIVLASTGNGLDGTLQAIYKQTLGVDVEVRQYEFKDFQAGLNQGQFQMFVYGWVADYADPENFLRSLLGTGSPFNNANYSNEQFDNLMKQGDQQADEQQRLSFYSQAEQIALSDVPILPIYHNVTYMLVKPYVKNLVVTGEGIISLKDVYIQK